MAAPGRWQPRQGARATLMRELELSTDSRTGALGLYQKVGIKPRAALG